MPFTAHALEEDEEKKTMYFSTIIFNVSFLLATEEIKADSVHYPSLSVEYCTSARACPSINP